MDLAIKRVVILHDEIHENDPLDQQDSIVQVQAIELALQEMGYQVKRVAFGIDTTSVLEQFRDWQTDFVINLVESVAGDGRFIHWAPLWLEHLQIPFSGCSSSAIYTSSNKILAKEMMRAYGIPTPDWLNIDRTSNPTSFIPGRYIIKAVWEHASVGLDEDSVVVADQVEWLEQVLRSRLQLSGKPFFAEHYIDGREFNISILNGQVLPIPEIMFLDYPENKPRVVGYRAKWQEESFEYQHTQRRFHTLDGHQTLAHQLAWVCEDLWRRFSLKGYARVDVRVDPQGNPYVIDINANPCIAPDSGFVAAAMEIGISFSELLHSLIQGSLETQVTPIDWSLKTDADWLELVSDDSVMNL